MSNAVAVAVFVIILCTSPVTCAAKLKVGAMQRNRISGGPLVGAVAH